MTRQRVFEPALMTQRRPEDGMRHAKVAIAAQNFTALGLGFLEAHEIDQNRGEIEAGNEMFGSELYAGAVLLFRFLESQQAVKHPGHVVERIHEIRLELGGVAVTVERGFPFALIAQRISQVEPDIRI